MFHPQDIVLVIPMGPEIKHLNIGEELVYGIKGLICLNPYSSGSYLHECCKSAEISEVEKKKKRNIECGLASESLS